MKSKIGFKLYTITLSLIFLLFAQLQLNDPDALPWFSFYLWVALQPLAYLVEPRFRWAIGGSIAASLLGMLYYAPSLLQLLNNSDGIGLEQSMSHAYPYIEEARECAGLVIVAISNGVLLFGGHQNNIRQGEESSH